MYKYRYEKGQSTDSTFILLHGTGGNEEDLLPVAADLMTRGQELYAFIEEKAEEYQFSLEEAIYLGFSNGANIAMNMMLLEDSRINKGMLYAPMYPLDVEEVVDLPNVKVFLSMGENDPIVPRRESDSVIAIFKDLGAEVKEFWVDGHELNGDNLIAGKEWLAKIQ